MISSMKLLNLSFKSIGFKTPCLQKNKWWDSYVKLCPILHFCTNHSRSFNLYMSAIGRIKRKRWKLVKVSGLNFRVYKGVSIYFANLTLTVKVNLLLATSAESKLTIKTSSLWFVAMPVYKKILNYSCLMHFFKIVISFVIVICNQEQNLPQQHSGPL